MEKDSAPNAELTLRDHLAMTRTTLANERTFLAYVRTALALVGAGAFFIKFVGTARMAGLGWASVAIGLVVLAIGYRRYRQTKSAVARMTDQARP
ncbi:MAG TPA: DUF202 domain-containing protein [Candidatus Hydrogenedentes bacterium]|nr:DUF202 domain-containing protein [Candidatus Hydrogenedentota bacterium]